MFAARHQSFIFSGKHEVTVVHSHKKISRYIKTTLQKSHTTKIVEM